MKHFMINKCCVELTKESLSSVISCKVNACGREDKHDAFYVGDLGDIIQKYNNWRCKLPRVEPFYAVKCNDNPAVLALLAQLGTGFDCASKAEIQKILDLKVSPSRIIYANPCKQTSYIQHAARHGVDLMTFDNETELHKIKANFPSAKLVVRILPPVNDKCIVPLGMKFGCLPKQVPRLLKVAKELDLDVIGVSFHVGSACYDASAYTSAIVAAKAVFTMAESAGFHFNLLDIGGGFPGQPSANLSFDEISSVLITALDLYFPEDSGVRIIAEPGRYFVASAFTLAVNIIAKRAVTSCDSTSSSPDDVEADLSDPTYMYYVNDGVYGSFNCILFDHVTVEASLMASDTKADKPQYKCSIWGPTCDGLDCILNECWMPELDTGEWIVFRDMGAYTMASASCFNGIPRPKCYYILSEKDLVQVDQRAASFSCFSSVLVKPCIEMIEHDVIP